MRGLRGGARWLSGGRRRVGGGGGAVGCGGGDAVEHARTYDPPCTLTLQSCVGNTETTWHTGTRGGADLLQLDRNSAQQLPPLALHKRRLLRLDNAPEHALLKCYENAVDESLGAAGRACAAPGPLRAEQNALNTGEGRSRGAVARRHWQTPARACVEFRAPILLGAYWRVLQAPDNAQASRSMAAYMQTCRGAGHLTPPPRQAAMRICAAGVFFIR